MKNTLKIVAVLFAAALFGLTSKVQAQAITDNDLLEVASGLNVDVQHSDLGQANVEAATEVKEVNGINEKAMLGKFVMVNSAKSSLTDISTEGPEGAGEGVAEGPDLDGPGGPIHQFNGEETGNH